MAGRGSAGASPKEGKPAKRRPQSLVPQQIAGGGVRVFIPVDRVVGWVQRFSVRNAGTASIVATDVDVQIIGGNGTVAVLHVPFEPMAVGEREPLEALLHHMSAIGKIGILLVRAGAHSAGTALAGKVLTSSTHRPYVQGRTAAGGWSQQRYARRRGNQLDFSLNHAADLAAQVLLPSVTELDGLALGGDRGAVKQVLADRRLAALNVLPTRMFADIPEPRRVVLDEVAERALQIEIEVRPALT